MRARYFDATRKGNQSSFLTPTVVGERRPLLPSEFCAQSGPPPSKNADFDRFPLAIDEVRTLPLSSQRVVQNAIFCFSK